MFIIVEGPDCAGKSTFIDKMCRELAYSATPHTRTACGPPKPADRDVFEEYEQQADKLSQYSSVTISDRWHWGETIYGPMFRGKSRLNDAGWRHVELSLLARNTIVVYLHETSSVLLERLLVRGDDLVSAEHLCDIEAGYHWCLRNTALPVISLRSPDDQDAVRVIDIATRVYADARAWLTKGHPSYIGSTKPKALLFGDRRGGTPPHNGDRFAFTPRGATSGSFLLGGLSERLWPHLGIANSAEEDCALLWRHLGQPPTVALGVEAHKRLNAADVPHASVPHPQFIRRFHHDRQHDYGWLIEHVIGTERNELGWRGV